MRALAQSSSISTAGRLLCPSVAFFLVGRFYFDVPGALNAWMRIYAMRCLNLCLRAVPFGDGHLPLLDLSFRPALPLLRSSRQRSACTGARSLRLPFSLSLRLMLGLLIGGLEKPLPPEGPDLFVRCCISWLWL